MILYFPPKATLGLARAMRQRAEALSLAAGQYHCYRVSADIVHGIHKAPPLYVGSKYFAA